MRSPFLSALSLIALLTLSFATANAALAGAEKPAVMASPDQRLGSAGDFCPAGPEMGRLEAGDPIFNRPYVNPGGVCTPSLVGVQVYYDLYSYNLAGPAPHELLASLCAPNGSAQFDSVLVAYRTPLGSENPFDPAQPCTNLLAYNDDACGLQSQISLAGLDQGWVDVVVTSFANDVSGAYTLFTESATCQATTPASIAVLPASLAVAANAGQAITRTLAISNAGEADLVWTIVEEETTPQKGSPITTGGDPRLAAETLDDLPAFYPSNRGLASPSLDPAGSPWPQDLLHDNGPLANGFGTGVGGADEAILQNRSLGMSAVGFGQQAAAGNRVADDFSIFDAEGWTIDRITFFAYQTGAAIAPSTMISVNFRIWDGEPGQPGSSVLFGDTTTNRMIASTWSGVYRVTEDSSGAATDRPIMANVVEAGVYLPAGVYWLDWQTGGSLASGPWASPLNIDGRAATGNGLHFTGAWNPAVDAGSDARQGFPFLIEGRKGIAPDPCSNPADMPWLAVWPLEGVTAGGQASLVNLIFQADRPAGGRYSGNLCINSNDPDQPLVVIPVTLTMSYDLYLPFATGHFSYVILNGCYGRPCTR